MELSIAVLLVNICILRVYFNIGVFDSLFKHIHPPFRLIKPRFLNNKKHRQGRMVNICYWGRVFVLILFVLANVTALIIYLSAVHLNSGFVLLYFFVFLILAAILSLTCQMAMNINNSSLQEKFDKENPSRAYRHIGQPKDFANLPNWERRKELSKICKLQESLKKYCYTKEKGILYIQNKDLERIRKKELIKYKYACEKTEYNEKGQPVFAVYDRVSNHIIFQAPIKM